MNEKLRKLRLISRIINADLFFDIAVSVDSIKLQGNYNYQIVKYLKNHRFNIEICNDGFTRATRSDVRIVMS